MRFIIKYNTEFGQSLVLCLAKKNFPMQWQDGNLWVAEVDMPAKRCKYHYELVKDGFVLRVEPTEHTWNPADFEGKSWRWDWWQEKPAKWYQERTSVFGPYGARVAGVAVPVFALRSENSFGVGEFQDLKLLVDFAEKTGMHCIQLLPVNDSTRSFEWTDSYPYNACSSFALHPQYLNLQSAGVKVDKSFKDKQKELNSLTALDYPEVNKTKDATLRKAFALHKSEIQSKECQTFMQNNKFWLVPYACFRALSAQKGTADFSQWEEMKECRRDLMKAYAQANEDEVLYHVWVQYHLDKQFKEVVDYARSKKVYFKGDLPIGVSRHSADAWEHPDLFNMDSSAGAPPDYFSRDGQNWGFPTYNWEAMEADGYQWWKARLKKMSEYFDAYRIDHILGFFRIWEIPYSWGAVSGLDVSGLYGHFNPSLPYSRGEIEYFDLDGLHDLFLDDPRHPGMYTPKINAMELPGYYNLSQEKKDAFNYLYFDFFFHRHDTFWKEKAEKKLSTLTRSSSMVACGEDLGMMADCVPGVMEENGILSLEIPRMPKGNGREFGYAADYPYESVCTTSTHDMSPMRLWWNNAHEQAQHYFNNVLGQEGQANADPSGDVCKLILANVLKSPSALCIIPLQDWLCCSETLRCESDKLYAEQINDPSNPRNHWAYRMNVTLEQMLKDKDFSKQIKGLIEDCLR